MMAILQRRGWTTISRPAGLEPLRRQGKRMRTSVSGITSLYATKLVYVLGLLLYASVTCFAQPAAPPAAKKESNDILASPLRSDQDRSADAARKPMDFLNFAQVRPGMMALDIGSGAGYTAQLLALAVQPGGKVWAQGENVSAALKKRFEDPPQANVTLVARPFEDPLPENLPKLDLITIVMIYHDIAYMPVDRVKMDHRLFDALKPGGRLIVVDHSAKGGTGVSATKTLHRIDEAVIKQELTQAGFQLDGASDVMRNPADPREQAFFDTKIPTDKFMLRFVKP